MKHRARKPRAAGPAVQTLQELRIQRGMTQVELAEVLTVTQAALSKLERRSDVKLSTLRAYVQALGGQLSVVAKFADKAVGIELPHDAAPASR
jgi:transcriptional regulator with XRE-family HTH domain